MLVLATASVLAINAAWAGNTLVHVKIGGGTSFSSGGNASNFNSNSSNSTSKATGGQGGMGFGGQGGMGGNGYYSPSYPNYNTNYNYGYGGGCCGYYSAPIPFAVYNSGKG
ncbi:MAG TPA: hypothetical protein VIJ88_01640 [Candidatus Paceibacterota bacterium]